MKKYSFKVSIIIAVRNEEKHIQECLDSLLNQTEKNIEIIVIDGESEDNTISIVKKIQKKHSKKIKLFTNPARRAAEARNIGYNAAKGEYVGFIDGHTYAKKNWVETLLKTIEKSSSKVGGVGSIHNNAGKGKFGIATTLAFSSPIGGGGSSYKVCKKLRKVNTAYAIMYRREALWSVRNKKKEFYNPYFIKGQDAEMNLRIGKNGFDLLQQPKAITHYYKRLNLKAFWKQMLVAGFWRLKIIKKHPDTLWRSKMFFAPTALFLSIIALGILPFFETRMLAAGLFGLYALVLLLTGLKNVTKMKSFYYLNTSILLFCIHLGYSIGLLKGILCKKNKTVDRVKQ